MRCIYIWILSLAWQEKCIGLIWTKRSKAEELGFVVLAGEIEMRYEVISHATAASAAPFPERTDILKHFKETFLKDILRFFPALRVT